MSFFFSLPQIYFNYLANYIPNVWNYEQGCTICDQDMVDLSQLKVSHPMKATVAVFVPFSLSTRKLYLKITI